jgi:hypothetical protein
MRLKPEELVCSSVNRQLKQTAIKEKQMPLKKNEIAMDSLYGSPNLQGFGNLEGLRFGLTCCSRAREPAGHPPEAVCRSGTGTERARDGTMVRNPVVHSFAGIAVGFNQRKEDVHTRTGLQPHLFVMRLKPEELFCSSVTRQLKQTAMEEKETAMEEKQTAMKENGFWYGNWLQMLYRCDGTTKVVSSIPEGLHVYRKANKGAHTTPAGVAPPSAKNYFYKHLMQLASAPSANAWCCGLNLTCSAEAKKSNRKCRISNKQYSMVNAEWRMMNKESGNNIPVLRTSGYNAVPYSTNITGALHLGFQTTSAAISETAAAPRNICRTAGHPSGKKVQSTETLKGITAQVTAHDTRRLGNALGDKQTKTNSKKVKR